MEEYPCLWNSTLKEYCKKEVTDCVWQAVSEEMKVPCYVLIDWFYSWQYKNKLPQQCIVWWTYNEMRGISKKLIILFCQTNCLNYWTTVTKQWSVVQDGRDNASGASERVARSCLEDLLSVVFFLYFTNGQYIECLSLTYASNKSKT